MLKKQSNSIFSYHFQVDDPPKIAGRYTELNVKFTCSVSYFCKIKKTEKATGKVTYEGNTYYSLPDKEHWETKTKTINPSPDRCVWNPVVYGTVVATNRNGETISYSLTGRSSVSNFVNW